MSNLSDKELDRLSREAAEYYEPDQSSLSWSRLEQKLSGQMPERPPDGFRFGRINPYVWGPAAVLLAGASFFLIKNNFYSKYSTQTISTVSRSDSKVGSSQSGGNTIYLDSISVPAQPDVKTNNPGGLPENTGTQPSNDAAENKNSALVKVQTPDAAAKNNSSDQDNTKKSTPVIADEYEIGVRTDKKQEASNTNQSNGSTVKKSSKNTTAIPEALAVSGSVAAVSSQSSHAINQMQSTEKLSVKENEPVSERKAASREIKSGAALPSVVYKGAGPGNIQGNDSMLAELAKSRTPAPGKSVRINRSLNFGLAFGPDYTDAGGITNNQLSNNIGITVGYYLTNKLSVNTGVFYSNKFYWSPGHGPGSPPPYSQGGISTTYAYAPEIEFVNGSCNMYEVPLTVRYDFAKTGEKTKFFVNAGLSSYFMVKQTYIYFFHNRGRALAWKTTDNSQSNYWFGVGDLSFGLETDMGKGFSFQAEPFLRIPLQQMGLENLKLNSYGIMLSFRYAPVLSRSKK
jgi:hypothetical protein